MEDSGNKFLGLCAYRNHKDYNQKQWDDSWYSFHFVLLRLKSLSVRTERVRDREKTLTTTEAIVIKNGIVVFKVLKWFENMTTAEAATTTTTISA